MMVTSIWCHWRRHQKRTMGPYASSPSLDTDVRTSTPVKYCKGSGQVCLPFSSLNALDCGASANKAMAAPHRSESSAVSDSPPSSERHSSKKCSSPRIMQPSRGSPFSRSPSSFKTDTRDGTQATSSHFMTSSCSTPTIVHELEPKKSSSKPPKLTLTQNSPDLVSISSSPEKKVHSPSFFPVKLTLAPCDGLLSPFNSHFQPTSSNSVPSIPNKISSLPSTDLILPTAASSSASSSAMLIPGCRSEFSPSAALDCHSSEVSPSPFVSSTSSPNILSKSLPSPASCLLKSRSRGLLERRGSNQSLTLNISCDNLEGDRRFSPRGDIFNAEEYLETASRKLSRKELRKVVKHPKRLAEEFWNIPMNLPDGVSVSGVATKNRYQSVLPNPATRVVLCDYDDVIANEREDAARYINANYVAGHGDESRAYIATQGPMEHTVSDFWSMVWKERSPIIVMITKLKEKNKSKCELYLPVDSRRYGDLVVRVEKVEQRQGFQLRRLLLTRTGIGEDGGDGPSSLACFHCWFTSWPDHKAPQNPKSLLDLIYFVEENRRCRGTRGSLGPVVVHCSAGIGRTGCFIAISIGVQQLVRENCVDVLGIVCRLRKDRGGMIQTSEQYEFIYAALAAFEKSLQSSPPILYSSHGIDLEGPLELASFLTRMCHKQSANQLIFSPRSAPLPPP